MDTGRVCRQHPAADQCRENQTYRDHLEAGKLYVLGLGILVFRDTLALPKTPAKLITGARDATGHFYASFVCASGEGKNAVRPLTALPIQEGMPKTTGLDFGLIPFADQ